jgi:2-polyprenyl-3-methyl-5-hydroxy-6-metoxy-1,4-benzoquinol methylase
MKIREARKTMQALTEEGAERNIYCHKNPIARDIFWQRLEILSKGIEETIQKRNTAIDFGGDNGAFIKGLAGLFKQVEVIDLDPEDAKKMASHQKVQNVRIHQGDIETWSPKEPADAVVATDVLEHFENLESPISRIKEYLKPEGWLCFSVPTENWLYELGRKVIGKSKPADHYHPAITISRALEGAGFIPVWERCAPNYGVPIPLFQLGIYKKRGGTNR